MDQPSSILTSASGIRWAELIAERYYDFSEATVSSLIESQPDRYTCWPTVYERRGETLTEIIHIVGVVQNIVLVQDGADGPIFFHVFF